MRNIVCLFAVSALAVSAQVPNMPPAEKQVNSPSLPQVPIGQSSALGGKITKLDLVRDQFILSVPGKKTFRIFFDSRTQVFEDGKKISVLDLHPTEHASVETRLDGTDIFAVRVHILTELPQGNLRGQVASFQADAGKLELHVAGSETGIGMLVPKGTPIVRIGEQTLTKHSGGFADLVPGSIVEVTFKPGEADRGSVTRIAVLATPGAEVLFHGQLVSLDLEAGHLSVVAEQDPLPTNIDFDPSRLDASHSLRIGAQVKIAARFDGQHYTATSISLE